MPNPSSPPRRLPASGPKTARQQELNTKRRKELSELAFAYKAASEGFGIAKPYGDTAYFRSAMRKSGRNKLPARWNSRPAKLGRGVESRF